MDDSKGMNFMNTKVFHVRVLDFKYLRDFEQLNFWYLTYEVTAKNEKEAVKKARKLYMKGHKELFAEELPFLLKLFSINHINKKMPDTLL